MASSTTKSTGAEVSAALAASGKTIAAVAVFSGFVNLLMLVGPMFMLQVYDRVLTSRSVETLLALCVLAGFLYAVIAVLDLARTRIMSRCAARFQARLDDRVFSATLTQAGADGSATALRDLEAMQRALAGPVALAIMDLPWAPLFLAATFLFHPLMGWFALAGGTVLLAATLARQLLTQKDAALVASAALRADHMAEHYRLQNDQLRAMGMQTSALLRWRLVRGQTLVGAIRVADIAGAIGGCTRIFRLALQSAMLALGAWLTLRGQLSGGAMVASSVLLGRFLAPVEGVIAGWAIAQRAYLGWRRLDGFLNGARPPEPYTALPKPRARLEVCDLTIAHPNRTCPIVQQVSFRVDPGQILGIIGRSGTGKSTLLRALVGIAPPAMGQIRLDGAALGQYSPEVLGAAIGYLPQQMRLFDGTIAENIARLALKPDAKQVVLAAKRAGAHDMIVALPDGYDTKIGESGAELSGGQVQRIGLARALFGAPALLFLDEPDASLDGEGALALAAAIRSHKAAGGSVLLITHRQAFLKECDIVLELERGAVRSIGPKDTVLNSHLRIAAGGGQSATAGASIRERAI